VTEPLVRSPVTNSSLGPPSRASPPSPPFPHPDRCLRPPEASPSHRILPSAAAVFPLSGERPSSFAIPKLELILSSPFHTDATGPHTHSQIGANSLFPLPHRYYRTPHPPSPPIRAPSPPANATVLSPSSTSPPPYHSGTRHPCPPCPASPRRVVGALGVHLAAG
jgi:hypothetical protein